MSDGGLVLAEAWARLSANNGNDVDDDEPTAFVTIGRVRDINDDGGAASDGEHGGGGKSPSGGGGKVYRVPKRHPAGHAQPPPFVVEEARRAKRREGRTRRQQERDVFARISNSRSRPTAMSLAGGNSEWTFIDHDDDRSDSADETGREDGGDSYQSPTPYRFDSAVPDHLGAAIAATTRRNQEQRENLLKQQQQAAAAAAAADDLHHQQQSTPPAAEDLDAFSPPPRPSSNNNNMMLLHMPPDNTIIDASSGYPADPYRRKLPPYGDDPNPVEYMFGPSDGEAKERQRQQILKQLLEEQRRHKEVAAEKQREQQQQRIDEDERRRSQQQSQSQQQKESLMFDDDDSFHEHKRSPIRARSIDREFRLEKKKHQQDDFAMSSSPGKLSSYQVRFLKNVSHSREQALRVLPLLPASQREMVRCAIVEDLCATTRSSVAATDSYVKRGFMVTPISAMLDGMGS